MLGHSSRRVWTPGGAGGEFTLDDVRNNQSAYVWNGPITLAEAILFADDGTDFGGTQRSLSLNDCSYDTGVDGGIAIPGGTGICAAFPTEWQLVNNPAVTCSVLIRLRVRSSSAPAFSLGFFARINNNCELDINGTNFRMHNFANDTIEIAHGAFLGNDQTFTLGYNIQNDPDQGQLMMHDGTDSGFVSQSVYNETVQWVMRYIGGNSASSISLWDATINAMIGSPDLVSMAQVQDFHNNPESWFALA